MAAIREQVALTEHKPVLLLSILAGSDIPNSGKYCSVEVHVDTVKRDPIWQTGPHIGGKTPAWDAHVVLAGTASDWDGHSLVLLLVTDGGNMSPLFKCEVDLTSALYESVPAKWYPMKHMTSKAKRRKRIFFLTSSSKDRTNGPDISTPTEERTPRILVAVTLIRPETFRQSHVKAQNLRQEIEKAENLLRQRNAEVELHLGTLSEINKQKEASEREFSSLIGHFQTMMRQADNEKSTLVQKLHDLQNRLEKAKEIGRINTEIISNLTDKNTEGDAIALSESTAPISPYDASTPSSSPRFLEPTKSVQVKLRTKFSNSSSKEDGGTISPNSARAAFDNSVDKKKIQRRREMEEERQAAKREEDAKKEKARRERAEAAKKRMDARSRAKEQMI